VIAHLNLGLALRARLVAEAEAVFPRECCGLIEGMREHAIVHAAAVHPTRNLASRADRFEIDPAAHIALLRRLRGTGREVVGCYHSHPNGAAALSPWDRRGPSEIDFLWLVLAIAPKKPGFDVKLAAFNIDGNVARDVPVSPLLDYPAGPSL
jgi:desampylase